MRGRTIYSILFILFLQVPILLVKWQYLEAGQPAAGWCYSLLCLCGMYDLGYRGHGPRVDLQPEECLGERVMSRWGWTTMQYVYCGQNTKRSTFRRHFQMDCLFKMWCCSLNFTIYFPISQVYDESSLAQVMAWCPTDGNPPPQPMLTHFPNACMSHDASVGQV